MEGPAAPQMPVVRPRPYAWAVEFDPTWGTPTSPTTREQMFFLGEPVSHIVAYEEFRRDLMRRRGGEIHIAAAQRRRSLVTPYSIALPGRASGGETELLSAA